ncbi:unnamed protein product [Blepharisma stoltei]|uniref:Uncharacterized protein n=1 Tax=Blepharisma stoltei TaxID=1481888 RepID=A0AAU9IFI1_9CILI|nr:unnamed protein product [Blepharisma stoltei]
MNSRYRHMTLNIECSNCLADSIFTPLDIADSAMLKSPPNTPFLDLYEKLSKEFHSSGVSHLRQFLLKKLVNDSYLSKHWPYKKVYSLLNSIAHVMLFNELEVIYWGILINSTSPEERTISPRMLSIFTAYLAKISMNEDNEPFEQFMNMKFPKFRLSFNNWLLITSCSAEPNLKELNKKYNQLIYYSKKKKEKKDYTEMVESLMKCPGKKEAISSENASEISSVEDLDEEIEAVQQDFLIEDKLSPLDIDVR